MFKVNRQERIVIYIATLFLIVTMLCVALYYRVPRASNAIVLNEREYYVLTDSITGDSLYAAVTVDSDTIMVLSSDTLFLPSITRQRYCSWVNTHWWPSCFGKLAAREDSLGKGVPVLHETDVRTILDRVVERQRTLLDVLRKQHNEINYFLRVHGVQDEGYDVVARRLEKVMLLTDSLERLQMSCERMLESKQLTLRRRYEAFTSVKCNRIATKRDGYEMWQTVDHSMPDTAVAVNLHQPLLFGSKSIGFGDTPSEPLRNCWIDEYIGETDSLGRYEGPGVMFYRDGSAYEGHWHEGKRSGFGVGFSSKVSMGRWDSDKYLGETLLHSADRIYGIDISRYQHEQGKKRYNIQWKNLRITSLGKATAKQIRDDKVDYHVSFVYIKSTEGISVFNKYYLSDYVASRRNGYRTGTYHFFSTRTPALKQAQHFLKKSRYQHGDMPPVLDVEPTAGQIRAMGGTDALMKAMRQWVDTVERQWHVRPVLYVSQSFVNRYLSDYFKDNYPIWIARYGEYKPDVHLVYWQLAQDGRVNGIHGDVDINVFNGYKAVYDEY